MRCDDYVDKIVGDSPAGDCGTDPSETEDKENLGIIEPPRAGRTALIRMLGRRTPIRKGIRIPKFMWKNVRLRCPIWNMVANANRFTTTARARPITIERGVAKAADLDFI